MLGPRILLAYALPPKRVHHLERSLRKVAEVTRFDMARLPDKDVLRARLPWGLSAKATAGRLGIRPDLYVEIDGPGRRHLRNPGALDCPSALWAIDSHLPYKREFLRYAALDFDHAFVAQKDDVTAFRGPGTEAHWLPLACDPAVQRDLGLPRDVDVGFVGSMDRSRHPTRAAALQLLARAHRVEAKEGAYDEELARVYSRSKVAFNRSISGDVNARVFEAIACGAALVTDRIGNGLPDLFGDREHLFLYDEWTLLDLVDEILADDELRTRVAEAGRRRVLERHSYDHRAAEILRATGFRQEAERLVGATAKAGANGFA